MSPDSDAAGRLRERGYAVSDPPPPCTCGHGDIVHRFANSEKATKGPRGACSVHGPSGQCPCAQYTPAEVPRGD